MKNLSLALNAVLAVAVIVLYVLHFNGQETEVVTAIDDVQTKEDTSTQESIAEAVSVVVGASSSNLPVAWVSLDSLYQNYAFVKRLENQIKAKAKLEEESYRVKDEQFRRDVEVFQSNVQNGGYTSQQEVDKRQRALLIQERELAQEEQRINYDLQSQQIKMRSQVAQKISDFVKKYNEKSNYSYIIAKGEGSPILFAHDSLNITASVLKGLNSEYKK